MKSRTAAQPAEPPRLLLIDFIFKSTYRFLYKLYRKYREFYFHSPSAHSPPAFPDY